MSDESTAAPNPGSANPAGDWRTSFAGSDATVLETLKPFEKPGDFFKSWSDTSTELKTLKEAPAFDWRKEISGGDEQALKMFERFAALPDAGKAYAEAVKKISSGELAKPLPKDATPEQVAAWRKGNGIPEKPEGYYEKLPNGRVIGADDKPLFDDLAKRLHGLNVPPAAVHEIVDFYYGNIVDGETAKITEAERAHGQQYEDALRKDWGNDYRANVNHLENFLSGMPEQLRAVFKEGFGPDGRKLSHNPEMTKWLAGIAREFNPAGFVTPGGNENQMSTISDEINSIKAQMSNPNSEYWKGPRSDQIQARYRELLDAQAKLQQRGRAA